MSEQPKRSMLRDAMKMVGSGSVIQAVALLLVPLISVLYPPETLGIYGLFAVVLSIISIVAGGRYEQAIVVAKEQHERVALVQWTLIINLAVAVLLSLLVFVLKPFILTTSYADVVPYLWALPVVVPLLGIFNALGKWAVSTGQFDHLMCGQMTQGLSNNGGKVALAYPQSSVWGLIIAQGGSYILGGCLLLRMPVVRQHLLRVSEWRWSAMKQVANRYVNFPKYGIPQALIDTLLGSLLVLLLPQGGYSMTEIGWLTMSVTLARRPLQVIADNLSLVYFNRLAEARQSDQPLMPLIRRITRRWLIVALPSALLLYFAMPWLVDHILDDGYRSCSTIIRCMLPMLIPSFVNSIINVLPDVLERQRAHFMAQLLMLIAEVVVIGLLIQCQVTFEAFMMIFYLAVMAFHLVYYSWFIRLARQHDRTCA